MSVPDELAAQVLAKCGRRCCLCRRFLPIRLQVHHIIEQNKGGSDDLHNLIALCLTCHTDVHTKAPFTRRFTVLELKMHRDALYKAVEANSLPAVEGDWLAQLSRLIENASVTVDRPDISRDPIALRLLLTAASGNGDITLHGSSMSTDVFAGGTKLLENGDARTAAAYRHALKQLATDGYVEPVNCENDYFQYYRIAHNGHLKADELLAEAGHIETD
jgi:hypothetical protein